MLRILETGAARDEALLVVVAIHGRDRQADEMAAFGEILAVDGICYLCPEAPGNSWYPGRFMEPVETNEPALGSAISAITGIVDGLSASGRGDRRIVLCGFSQGACLAAEILVRRPAPYAAVIVLTGGLIGPPGTVWNAPVRIPGVPVLLTGSEIDDWVPAARVRETASMLDAAGAGVDLHVYPDRTHEICADEVLRARTLLRRLVRDRRRRAG